MKFGKKLATASLAGALCLSSLAVFAGCGNKDIFDFNYNLKYAVVEENGEHVLHQIESWTDSESESVTFRTSCCDNYIWTSANNAILYEKKPDASKYTVECGHEH